jgi:predicted ATPase
MGIQELEIKGFKSLRHVRWTPGRLNVLIGPNGSGKSNLLQALELLQLSAKGQLSKEILRQGGLFPILWDSKASELSWTLLAFTQDEPLNYHLSLQPRDFFGSFRIRSETLSSDTKLLNRTHESIWIGDGESRKLEEVELQGEQTALSRFTGFSTDERLIVRSQSYLSSWSIYQNLRVDRSSAVRSPIVARYERRISDDGQNLVSVLHTLYTGDRDFKQAIDDAMGAAFGSEYEELLFPPAADQMIQLRIRWRSLKTEQSASNLSDGTLRFLMIIAILASPESGAVVAIDEPETGLHPKMFPIIAEFAVEAARKKQVIFTTHSSQFLDAFREEPPTTTVIECMNGETRLTVLDEDRLREWLKHYSLGDLYETGELEGMA